MARGRRSGPPPCGETGGLHGCPADALVVDETSLPADADGFFEASRRHDGQVVVDLAAAQAIQQERVNAAARRVARDRADRAAIGLSDDMRWSLKIGQVAKRVSHP